MPDGQVIAVASQADGNDLTAEPITVFLLDDHEVVRRGVRDLLGTDPRIRVAGEAGTASSALARIDGENHGGGPGD